MVLFGGVRTVESFVQHGLVNEYWLKVNPVALGAGLPIFGALSRPQDLELVWQKAYASGVVGLRYRRRSSESGVLRSRYVA